MIDPFYLKLILAFFIGALWVTGATRLAEKFGSKVGGVILGLPSVALLGLFFIGWTQSAAIASEATTVVPIEMGIAALFVTVYIVLSRYHFYLSILAALLTWFVLSFILVAIHFNNITYSLMGFALFLAVSYLIVEKIIKIPSSGKKQVKSTFSQVIFRSFVSGGIIAFSVILTKIGGPLLGGVFASFPGMMLSSLIVTHKAHGSAFSAAVLKTLMISGPLNVVIYALCIRYLYLSLGLVWGTIVGFIISSVTSYFTYLYLRKQTA